MEEEQEALKEEEGVNVWILDLFVWSLLSECFVHCPNSEHLSKLVSLDCIIT